MVRLASVVSPPLPLCPSLSFCTARTRRNRFRRKARKMETTDSAPTIAEPPAHADERRPRTAGIILAILATVTAVGLYLLAAHEQSAHQNPDRLKHDQSAVIHFSERLVKYGWHYAIAAPRNRMPLYPYLQSLVFRPGMNDDSFFEAAKRANVWLSLILLTGVFGVFRLYLPAHASLNAVLIAGFGVFALKAPYVQAEILYYFWTFLYFLLMVRMLRRPGLLPALGLGAVLAVAHMTKASTLPAILLFLLFYAIKAVNRKWFSDSPAKEGACGLFRLAYGPLAIVVFLAMISPYLRYSKEKYHSYFYNVNSTFYMWCDTWTEAKTFSDTYDDRHKNPNYEDHRTDSASEELPSFSRYMATHSAGQIVGRFVHGLGRMFTETFRSIWYMPYLLLFGAGSGYALWKSWPGFREALLADPATPAFISTFFLSYIALYAWWMILARSQRFVLTLFLPLLFVLTYLCHTYGQNVRLRIHAREYALPAVMDWAGTALAVLNIPLVLLWAAKAVNGGSTM
jgi:hypothetical protein